MLALLIAMLMHWTARASYGGSRCVEGHGGDSCVNNECRITGSTRRRTSRVGAYYCYGGLYKNIWYLTTTTESQCNATPTANIASSLVRDFPFDSTKSIAIQNAQKSGECYVSSPASNGNIGVSQKQTCQGVANGQPYVTMRFSGTTCLASNWSINITGSQSMVTISGVSSPYPCFCNSDTSKYNPTSNCKTCDTSEVQCSDQTRCNAAKDSKCNWASNTCQCKTGNYRKETVCINQALHDTYFQASTYATCTAFTAGSYTAFPSNSRRRGGATTCKSEGGTRWLNGKGYSYVSKKDYDCTGVTDGGRPNRLFYDSASCVGLISNINETTTSSEECDCLSATDQIRSDCYSCGGNECSTKQSCSMSHNGNCFWNNQNSSCSCASGVYKSSRHCWNGAAAEIIYAGVTKDKCTTMDTSSVTIAKAKDVSDDSSWTECRSNHDTSGAKANATHYKERSCTGVANGQAAKKAYWSNSQCSGTPLVTEAETSSSDSCQCELYNGCSAGTKFEKYFCADSSATSSIIAVEYSDGACTTPTGAPNRTLTSVTDALNPGVCGAWPPINLKPNYDSSVILKCDAAFAPTKYYAWDRTDRSSATPNCGTSPTNWASAANTGSINDCFCKGELMFNAIAAAQNVQVSGELTMTVSDVAAAVNDVKFKTIVRGAIADTGGVAPASVVGLTLSAATRRLGLDASEAPRALSSGGIKADYIIVVPKSQETVVKASVDNATPAQLSSAVSTKVTAASLSFTATVTAKSAAASAPATVAVSTSGSVVAQGLDPTGQPKPSGNSGAVFSHSTASLVLLLMVLCIATMST